MRDSAPAVLAFDAAGSACAVAVRRGGTLLASVAAPMRRGQAERLVPLIESALAEAEVPAQALDAVAVTTGPGGFTGVRIGLAAARGYALALGIPVIGLNRFEVTAAGIAPQTAPARIRLVALDARRPDIYLQSFAPGGEALAPPWTACPQDLPAQMPIRPLLLAGDAAATAAEALDAAGRDVIVAHDTAQTDPAVLARLALAKPWPSAGDAPPRPLYMRAPDVTLPETAPPSIKDRP